MFKKTILLILGSICLIVGGIGIAVPVLPTTPFVLIAAFCYAGSSPKLYEKLLKTRYFGDYIKAYKDKSPIELSTCRTSLIFVWAALITSMLFSRKLLATIVLTIVGIAVTIHILYMFKRRAAKTKEHNQLD